MSDTSASDLSLMEDGLLDDAWFDAVHNRLSSFLLVIYSTIQRLCSSFMMWVHGTPCAACGKYPSSRASTLRPELTSCIAAGLRETLASKVEQLDFVKQSYEFLQNAYARLQADSAVTRQMVQLLQRKLRKTADLEIREQELKELHAKLEIFLTRRTSDLDAKQRGLAQLEVTLRHQTAQLDEMRGEVKEMTAKVQALSAENAELRTRAPSGSPTRRLCQRLEEQENVLQRQLLTAKAGYEDLRSRYMEMARKLELAEQRAKLKEDVTKELAIAREDIEVYEHQTFCQQDTIRELRRLLHDARRTAGVESDEMRKSYEEELRRLRKEDSERLDAVERQHRQDLTTMQETVNAFYRKKLEEWDERERTLIEQTELQCALDAEEQIKGAVSHKLQEGMRLLEDGMKKRELMWQDKVAILQQQNRALVTEMQAAESATQEREDRWHKAIESRVDDRLRVLQLDMKARDEWWHRKLSKVQEAKKRLARHLAGILAFVGFPDGVVGGPSPADDQPVVISSRQHPFVEEFRTSTPNFKSERRRKRRDHREPGVDSKGQAVPEPGHGRDGLKDLRKAQTVSNHVPLWRSKDHETLSDAALPLNGGRWKRHSEAYPTARDGANLPGPLIEEVILVRKLAKAQKLLDQNVALDKRTDESLRSARIDMETRQDLKLNCKVEKDFEAVDAVDTSKQYPTQAPPKREKEATDGKLSDNKEVYENPEPEKVSGVMMQHYHTTSSPSRASLVSSKSKYLRHMLLRSLVPHIPRSERAYHSSSNRYKLALPSEQAKQRTTITTDNLVVHLRMSLSTNSPTLERTGKTLRL